MNNDRGIFNMSKTDGFTLMNGFEMNATYPKSFFIPPRKERNEVKPGHYVKMIFCFNTDDSNPECEGMWVKVLTRKAARRHIKYTGEINNISIYHPDLYGWEIEFGADNIIDINNESEEKMNA